MEHAKRPGQVVAGMAIRGSKVLMGKRKMTGLRPGLWELPGGKIEVDVEGDPVEFPGPALKREWLEELGVEVEVRDWIAVTPVLELEVSFVVDLYHVEFESQRPACLDHDELGWFEPLHAVKHMQCSPAFYYHFPAIRTWLDRRPRLAPST